MADRTIYPYGVDGQLPSSIGLVNDFTTGGADKAFTAEAGKDLYESLYGTEVIVITKDDAEVHRVKTSSSTDSQDGTRVRVVLYVTVGMKIITSCSEGKGVAAGIYSSKDNALKAANNYLQGFSISYTKNEITGTVQYAGYLVVSLCKSNESAFSDQEVEDYVDALELAVYDNDGLGSLTELRGDMQTIQEEVDALESAVDAIDEEQGGNNVLFLGKLLQKSLTSSGLSDTNADYRVSTASNMILPLEKATLTFHLPQSYGVGIRSGNTAGNLSNNDYWYLNGDTFTFSASVHYFRLCFAKGISSRSDTPSSTITVAEVEQLIETGSIVIIVSRDDGNIVSRNFDSEKYIKGIMRNFVSGDTKNGSLTKFPIFAHTSDVHGDATRFKSFLDYCDYLGVDAALVTGDTVASDPSDSMQYVNDLADTHITPVHICMGNHDARDLVTAKTQNETIMGYLITKNESVTNQTEEYPTYYYQDYSAKKIRIIAINLYELNRSNDNANFTQTQCEWLVNTLASTPDDYGVLIMFHSPEAKPSKDDEHSVFYQKQVNWTGYQSGISGNVFRQIVDAFISRTSATISYTSAGTAIEVTADFTSVASGVEFVAFLNGHLHTDLVGYVSGATNMQLCLNICCGVAIYGSTYTGLANLSDLPRGGSGSTQDSFNIYAIDRETKTVRIARVGSNVSGYDMEDRKFMIIPYAEV